MARKPLRPLQPLSNGFLWLHLQPSVTTALPPLRPAAPAWLRSPKLPQTANEWAYFQSMSCVTNISWGKPTHLLVDLVRPVTTRFSNIFCIHRVKQAESLGGSPFLQLTPPNLHRHVTQKPKKNKNGAQPRGRHVPTPHPRSAHGA